MTWSYRFGAVAMVAAAASMVLPAGAPWSAGTVGWGAVWAQEATPSAGGALARARALRDEARQFGARNTLPSAWSAYEKRLADLERGPASAEALAELEEEGRRLVNRATFLQQVRDARSPLEALLARYDRALVEIAALEQVPLEATISGDEAAIRLLDLLEQERQRRQALIDSLTVRNRHLNELAGGRVAAQDSLITALRVELSAVRHRLWETELRAGIAEADRGAAEDALSRRQAREAALQEILADLDGKAGAVMRPDGTIVLQVHGIDFAVGAANLAPGQAELMNKLAAAVRRFPGAVVRVEGHTDDTGSRAANLSLSQRRAATIAGGIERRLSLPEGSIETSGHGPDQPVAPNSTAEGRARNRRIDIVIAPQD